MIFTIIMLLLISVAAWLILRRSNNRDTNSNRYRHYQAKSAKPKVKQNRYQKPPRREPELGDVQKRAKPTPKAEKPVKPTKPAKKDINYDALLSNDPDVVLGLKEAPLKRSKTPIPTDAQITLRPPPPPPPMLSLHIMAENEKPYRGYELLQAMLSVGMRYGKHQIFHRHQEKTGQGPILFSLASTTRPGTFDLPKMGGFATPGLSLFFSAEDVENPTEVYELMLETAGQLVEDLAGHVLDERRQPLTPKKVVEHRRRLNEYMEAQEVPDLFEEI